MAKHNVEMDADSIIINSSTRLDRSLPTSFHSMRGRGSAYLLEAVFFQFKNRDLVYNNYVQSCRDAGVAHVFHLDKKDLLAYLTGEISTCQNLVSKKSLPSTSHSHIGKSDAGVSDNVKTQKQRASATSHDEKESDTFASNRKRDREQRCLDSVLMVKEWDFSSLREKLVQHVSNSKKSKPNNNNPSGNGSRNNSASKYDPRGDRYTNDEDRVWRENLGSDFHDLGIDMSGSFKDNVAPAATNGPSSSELPRDRTKTNRRSGNEAPSKPTRVDPKDLVPIIIVPNGFSTLLCHGNALEFIQDGHFLSHEELRKNGIGPASKVSQITAKRIPGGMCSRANYHIVFNPNRLTQSEWGRVVAVVCSGFAWQFTNWPIFEGGVHELFRKVQGFYFHYDDVVKTGEADKWAIKKLGVSRGKRHMDGQLQSQFWNSLDDFMRRKRSKLRY